MLFAAPDSEFVTNYILTEVFLAAVGFIVCLVVALVAIVVIKGTEFKEALFNRRAEEKWGRMVDELEDEEDE